MNRFTSTPRRLTAVLIAVFLCIYSAPGLVSATTYGGDATLLYPSKRSPVQLKQLAVTMQLPKKAERWHVHVRYVLKNRGSRDTTLDLVLPEHLCDSDKRSCRSATAGRLQKVVTTLNGAPITPAKPVKTAAKKSAPTTPGDELARGPETVMTHFMVTIKAKKEVVIEQRYRVARTTDGDGEIVNLRFGPSNRWHGPVAKAGIHIALHQRPWTVGHPRSFSRSAYTADLPTEGVMKGVATTHLKFFNRRLRPKEPLFVHFATAADSSPARRCPDLRAVSAAIKSKEATAELKRILVMRGLEELKRCRSLYLALYGFPFSAKVKKVQYYGKPVKSASARRTVMQGKRSFVRFGLQVNPSYVAELHPGRHRDYLRGLAAEIERRRGK